MVKAGTDDPIGFTTFSYQTTTRVQFFIDITEKQGRFWACRKYVDAPMFLIPAVGGIMNQRRDLLKLILLHSFNYKISHVDSLISLLFRWVPVAAVSVQR